LPERSDAPLFVLGAENDRIANPDDVRATATYRSQAALTLVGRALDACVGGR